MLDKERCLTCGGTCEILTRQAVIGSYKTLLSTQVAGGC